MPLLGFAYTHERNRGIAMTQHPSDVIETALANRPEDRFSSGDEMAAALERALGDLVTQYEPRRLANFVQGLFADEVMVRGRSAQDSSRLEKSFLTAEKPAARQQVEETRTAQ